MQIKEIKHEFMAFRNGVIADTLRKAGYPHRLIFGLQVPQLADIARRALADPDTDRQALAEELWADAEVRESRLLACWLFDPAAITPDLYARLVSETRTPEERDILNFRLRK